MTRVLLTGGVIGVWLLGVLGMWRGWRGKARRSALPQLPVVPEVPGTDNVDPLVGIYVGTTYAGAWLDRVAAARLGERSSGWLRVLPAGVVVRRPSYDDVFIPAGSIESVRIEPAHAGKVIGLNGVVVIEWRHGDVLLETGFHGDDSTRHTAVRDAVVGLRTSPVIEARESVKESP